MDNDEDIVREDQQKHPNCHYSTSLTKSCATKDGSMVCETLKNITRLCPNSRPVNVYSKRTKSDSPAGEEGFGTILPVPELPIPGLAKHLNDLLAQQQQKAQIPPPNTPSRKPNPSAGGNFSNQQDDYENGFQNLLKILGLGGGVPRKPPSDSGAKGNGEPKLPPGSTSGPSTDI